MLEPIIKLGLEYEFYNIDANLEPLSNLDVMEVDECLLYTNYFGLKDEFIRSLPRSCKIIIDNSQGFFSEPCPSYDTFYSPRKFFGVPDGGYLFTYNGSRLEIELTQAESYNRCNHLLKRIDLGAEAAYEDFKVNDQQLSNEPVLLMSNLSQRILSSIDYKRANTHRISNFNICHKHLSEYNLLPNDLLSEVNIGPLIYPFMIDNDWLRHKLISEHIYIPQYWSNVLEWSPVDSLEYKLTKNVIPLPIDQRWSNHDMERTLNVICKELGIHI